MKTFKQMMSWSRCIKLRSTAAAVVTLLTLVVWVQPTISKDRSGQPFKYLPISGDIIFQRSKSPLGPAIEIATGSYVTHVGITMEDNDTMFVYEAVGPVRKIPLNDWIRLGVDEQICVKRLTRAKDLLSNEVIEKIRREFIRYEGREYDLQFEWSDDRLYCSEFVYKVLKRAAGLELGRFQRFGEFKLDDPTVQFWIETYFPKGPDLDEKVISPVSIYQDTALVTVFSTFGWRSEVAEKPAGN
jgi:hypothetical protein